MKTKDPISFLEILTLILITLKLLNLIHFNWFEVWVPLIIRETVYYIANKIIENENKKFKR